MELGVLGPVRVVADGVEVRVPRGRQRLLLARLMVDAGRVVPVERLLDEVWGRTDHDVGTGAVRTAVWELRRHLDAAREANGVGADDVLVARDGGYVLAVDPGQIDHVRFEQHLAVARSSAVDDPDRAVAEVDQALALWRGPAFGELAGELALHVEAARLDQMVLDARELRAELLLDLGGHDQLVPELGALARANPERERLWALLMTALYRSGRQSEALSCYQEARRSLVAAAGVEPGPELRQLEAAILHHDPALEWPRRPGSPDTGGHEPNSRSMGRVRPGPAGADPEEHGPPGSEREEPGRPSATASGPGVGSRDGLRHSLPRPVTSLVGRGEEREGVADALGRSRLVTLVGVGGCGKTRLAIAVAHDVQPRLPGGVWFVDLAVLSQPELVPAAVADALGTEVTGVTGIDGSAPSGDALLVLDNCEHLVDAVAALVAHELEHRPDLRILATSREELGLDAETVWRLGGLRLPADAGERASRDAEAVELFLARAAGRLDGFAPGPEARALVGQICRRLDGLPLAIELTAAHVASLPIATIARRLDEDLDLPPGYRQGPPRHRTLPAALDWSVDLLDEPTRHLFAQLGVFAGGFTYASAEQVVGPEVPMAELTDGLGHLVRASLLGSVTGHDGVERYRMLDVVRRHAGHRLAALPDVDDTHRRYAHHFAAMAADLDRRVRGSDAAQGLEQLDVELPNLRAALSWAMAHDQLEVTLGLLVSLRWFLPRLAPLHELDRWLAGHVEHDADVAPGLHPALLATSSMVAFLSGKPDGLRPLSARAVTEARRQDDRRHLATGLATAAAAAIMAGELEEAEGHLDEARRLCEALGDRWGLAWTSVGRGMIAHETGRWADGPREMQAALDVFRFFRDRHSQVVPLAFLALHALAAGEDGRAHDLASEARELMKTPDHRIVQYLVWGTLALAEMAAGRYVAARDLFVRSLRVSALGTPESIIAPANMEGLAMLAAGACRHREAVVLVGAATRIRQSGPSTPAPRWVAAVDGLLDEAREALGPAKVDENLALGQDLPLEEVVRLAEVATQA